jgi:hypothetical protein
MFRSNMATKKPEVSLSGGVSSKKTRKPAFSICLTRSQISQNFIGIASNFIGIASGASSMPAMECSN